MIIILLTIIIVMLVLGACGEDDCHCDDDCDCGSDCHCHEVEYDRELAEDLGADQYGMKKYVFTFLKKGTNRDLSEEEARELQIAHLNNINRMAEERKLIVAGPFLDDGDIRGIYIFDVETVEEAEELTKTDPAIQNGVLSMEFKEWYGSAALMVVNDLHKQLEQKNVVESR